VRPPSRQSVRRPREDTSAAEVDEDEDPAAEDSDSTDVDAAARRSARVEPEPAPAASGTSFTSVESSDMRRTLPARDEALAIGHHVLNAHGAPPPVTVAAQPCSSG